MKQSTAIISFTNSFNITNLIDFCALLDVSGSAFYRGEIAISDTVRYRFYEFEDNSSIAIRINSPYTFTLENFPNSNSFKSIRKEYPDSEMIEYIED